MTPGPDGVACEMVTVMPPELVMVSDKLRLLPTCTFPKFKLDELAVSWPADVGVTAIPDATSVVLADSPLEDCLNRETVPFWAPGAAGRKVILRVKFAPGFSVAGKAGELISNPLAETEACVTVIALVVGLLTVSVKVLLEPTATVPKSS